MLHWDPLVACECSVQYVTLHTIGAFVVSAMVTVHLLRPEVFSGPFAVPSGFSHHVKLRRVQVNKEALAHLPLFRIAEFESYVIIFNSFSVLEADFGDEPRRF